MINLIAALKKIRNGEWYAKVSNLYERDYNVTTGPYPSKEIAEQEAQRIANAHNDSASYGRSVYLLDMDGEEILNLIDSLQEVRESVVLDKLEKE